MKKTEKKVRDKISEIVINHHPEAGRKIFIGRVFIEVYKYGDLLMIDCGIFYNTIFVSLLVDSEDVVRRFIVAPIGKGLIQLRFLLEKLKR